MPPEWKLWLPLGLMLMIATLVFMGWLFGHIDLDLP